MQHAFVALCRESHSRVGDRVAPWLYRVCRNRAVDHLRRAGREQSLVADPSANAHGETAALHEDSSSIDPAIAVERADLATRLHELMRDLPASQRETIDLWCEGFTYREIAAISGRQEGHVRVLAHRGLTALRQHPLVRELLTETPHATIATEHLPPPTSTCHISEESQP